MLAEFEGAPNIMHVAPGGGPVTPHDGTSWSTAYSTIEEALAPNGTRSNVVVLVAPGTYTEHLEVRGSNVSIVGAGACTRIEYTSPPPNSSVLGLPVVFIWASNVAFEDLQIVNLRPDAGGQSANAISLQYPGGTPTFQSNLVIRQCFMHGEATLWLHLFKGVFLLTNVLSGYENALIAGNPQAVSHQPENSTLAWSNVFRIEPLRNRNSPTLHLNQGSITACNSSFVSVAMADALGQNSFGNLAYRGILAVRSNCCVWACNIGVNAKPGVEYNGALFQGVFAQTESLVNAVGVAVRAVGKGPIVEETYVAALVKDTSSTLMPPPNASAPPPQWTLVITKVLAQ